MLSFVGNAGTGEMWVLVPTEFRGRPGLRVLKVKKGADDNPESSGDESEVLFTDQQRGDICSRCGDESMLSR